MMPPKPDKLSHVGVDFDGTIFNTSGYPDYAPTTIIEGAKEGLEKIVAMGYKVVIFTARPWSDLYLIKYLVKEYNLPVDQIICGKPLFLTLIDDRNTEFHNWNEVIDKVRKL
jgi:hypothetical protein